MALEKQSLNINFSQGLDTKTDRVQVAPGKFLRFKNAVFTKAGKLTKRNGFPELPALSDRTCTSAATFGGGLIAIGNSLQSYSSDTRKWTDQGDFCPLEVSVLPAVRASSQQTACDVAVASNGLACVVFLDSVSGSQYQVIDSSSGQVVVPAVTLPATAVSARAFVLGQYFVVMFLVSVGGTPTLRYISIPTTNPASPLAVATASSQVESLTAGWDGYVANNNLYFAWYGSDVGGALRINLLDSTLTLHSPVVVASEKPRYLSITADETGSTAVIWVSWSDAVSGNIRALARSASLDSVLAATALVASQSAVSITSSAQNGVLTVFYQNSATYSYSTQIYSAGAYSNLASVRCDSLKTVTLPVAGSPVGSVTVINAGAGLASKSFLVDGAIYLLANYQSPFQNTYFLLDSVGHPVAKLAYQNAGGYVATQVLSNVPMSDNTATLAYLFKASITALAQSPSDAPDAQAPVGGIYSQTGVNLAQLTIGDVPVKTAEIGRGLHMTGGFLWHYDGVKPREHGFQLYPDNLGYTTATTTGSMTAQQYFYMAVYEWTDGQGQLHRSAPSIPLSANLAGSGTATNKVTINVPTLKFTYKVTPNPVRIVLYRWSTASQSYYQITSITSPTLNDPSVASIAYVDTVADSSIVGNNLIYTNGGVVENIAAPACSDLSIYKSRLMVLSSEDSNLVWYSKQVIESTPVETSDLFTLYQAPTIGVQGGESEVTVTAVMDDKFITWRGNAIYYQTGNGPDITGAQNDFSEPSFITSTIGCENKASLVFAPQGLLFQSDKGIWMLGRDLSTQYIGAAVEDYTLSANVLAAVGVPGTNQVRFTLDSGITLMYDYFYGQWGTFEGIPAVSGVIYGGKHTVINSEGRVFQELAGTYLDGSRPVLIGLTTSWLQLAGIQGFQRALALYLLGEYITPHRLNVGFAFDYNEAVAQNTIITPTNYSPAYGGDAVYGGSEFNGGPASVEQWRVFLDRQKCQAVQVLIDESYDASLGVAPGEGLSLSSLKLMLAMKAGSPKLAASQSRG